MALNIDDVVIFEGEAPLVAGPNLESPHIEFQGPIIGIRQDDQVANAGGYDKYNLVSWREVEGRVNVNVQTGFLPVAARR